jgi:tyrosinase
MATPPPVGVRRSLRELQDAWDAGDRRPLEDVVRAWRGIQALPPDDPQSFFVLGGFHGEPFQLREAVDALSPTDRYAYWGGYCHHGNVLFPTWHRVYVRQLELALQRIVPGVMLPFWDPTDAASLAQGLPRVLTDESFVLDGQPIRNPLKSFVLPEPVQDGYPGDQLHGEQQPYFKPRGYETVRYPLSGLMGPKDRAQTERHNRCHTDPARNTADLNANVRTWLHGGAPTPTQPDPHGIGIYAGFIRCLDAPNYTVFSNTTSAEAWNSAGQPFAVPLEDPHNHIHLAVGGFDLPALAGGGAPSGRISGANGDMGENNTAALDPIFFFHHCNIDRMFWLWQQRHPDRRVEVFEG